MSDTTKMMQLVTGDVVIAMIDDSVSEVTDLSGHIELSYPIQVITEYQETSKGLNERFNLKPWQSLSCRDSIIINSDAVMLITSMKTEYVSGYIGMVEYFFLGGKEKEEDEAKKPPTLIPDISEDEKIH